jgi:hypothetical protein
MPSSFAALGGGGIVREQALDADRHVVHAARCIEPRCDRETEIRAGCALRVPAGLPENGREACNAAPRIDAQQALPDEDAVVVIEPHQVGDGAERHEVEIARRYSRRSRESLLLQRPAQRRHQVEGDADACEVRAAEGALRAGRDVRIHDGRRIRQSVAGQVMVGDQDVDPETSRHGHAVDIRNSVVDGHEQRGS